MIQHISDGNFKSLLRKHKIAVVDFWAEWCRPCRSMSEVMEEVHRNANPELGFFKMNVDANPATTSEYGVESLPTLLIFKDGMPVMSLVGAVPKTEVERAISAVK